MNKKLLVFFAAIALVLVGCNKEKEEDVGTVGTVANAEQQQQQQAAIPVSNVTPVAQPSPTTDQVKPLDQQGAVNNATQQAAPLPQQQVQQQDVAVSPQPVPNATTQPVDASVAK